MTTSRSTPSRYDCDPTERRSPVAENLKLPAGPVPLRITTSYCVELRTGVPSETASFGVGVLRAQTPGGWCVSPPLKGAPRTTIQTEAPNSGQHQRNEIWGSGVGTLCGASCQQLDTEPETRHVRINRDANLQNQSETTAAIHSGDALFSFATMRLRREEPPHHTGELNHASL